MKINILPIFFAACATAVALCSCEDDNIQIDPSTGNQQGTVDQGEFTGQTILSSASTPECDLIYFPIGGSDDSREQCTDKVKVILGHPYDHDVTLRIGMDPVYGNAEYSLTSAGEYNYLAQNVTTEFRDKYGFQVLMGIYVDTHNPDIGLNNNFRINGATETAITIKAGQIESEEMEIEFHRAGLTGHCYLFPIQVTDTETGELLAQTNYVVYPFDIHPEQIGNRPAVFVGYVDLEVMNPLISDKFILTLLRDDYNTGEQDLIYYGSFFEIINLRTALVKMKEGLPDISLPQDVEYVLRNRAKYIKPLKNSGLKVCLCIKGGNDGIGFANMTDLQIADFAGKAKVLTDMYGLDGINLWDENAGYDKEGAAPASGEAFAKLIKAMKEAMPDKLLTLVDTRETTEPLCDPQAGISVGEYLDYAWSDLNKFQAPYEPDASLRPLAGLSESKYATLFTYSPGGISAQERTEIENNTILFDYANAMATHPLTGTDVLVICDISYMDYKKEDIYYVMAEHWSWSHYPFPEDFSYGISASIECPPYMNDYYLYKKDW